MMTQIYSKKRSNTWKTTRVDIIGQNGNNGEHYLVEKMAKRLAGKDFDMMLSGKKGVRRKWEDFVPLAIELLDIAEEFQNE